MIEATPLTPVRLREQALEAARQQEEQNAEAEREHEAARRRKESEWLRVLLRNKLGIDSVEVTSPQVEIDGLPFRARYDKYDFGYDLVVGLPCSKCGTTAWFTVNSMVDLGDYLTRPQYHTGAYPTGYCPQDEDADDESDAAPAPEPTALEKLGAALVEYLQGQGFTVTY